MSARVCPAERKPQQDRERLVCRQHPILAPIKSPEFASACCLPSVIYSPDDLRLLVEWMAGWSGLPSLTIAIGPRGKYQGYVTDIEPERLYDLIPSGATLCRGDVWPRSPGYRAAMFNRDNLCDLLVQMWLDGNLQRIILPPTSPMRHDPSHGLEYRRNPETGNLELHFDPHYQAKTASVAFLRELSWLIQSSTRDVPDAFIVEYLSEHAKEVRSEDEHELDALHFLALQAHRETVATKMQQLMRRNKSRL